MAQVQASAMTESAMAATHEESPFHAGERLVQQRAGVRDRAERFGQRAIRDHMPEQHRTFFARLPMLLAGTVDDGGRPWASVLAGRPGFVSSPDERTLRIAATPLFGDPLGTTLAVGADIGLLGIEPHSRRRNRANGKVVALDQDGIEVRVAQSFGNCPQYIQTRTFDVDAGIDKPGTARPLAQFDALDRPARDLIAAADTLFIATAAAIGETAGGVDVSHRGGKPGFVRIDDDRTLVVPDFAGNSYFNTFGNLALDPRAGLLFIDFRGGDLVYLTGTAGIIWEGEDVARFAGAQRLLRFRLVEGRRVSASLPLRWTFGDYSPLLARTGAWTTPGSAGILPAPLRSDAP
jgi:predicted pyridoxine 5'-phosphate oxidase superfamily flavin-nucleotide-binding protein